MSKHWKPYLVPSTSRRRWAGRRDRHYWRPSNPRTSYWPTAGEVRLVILGGVAAGLAWATIPSAALTGEAVTVIDGDTFHYRGERIRIADIDTPELRGRCAEETALAARATQRMEELLRQGPFELSPVDRDQDRYGRKLRVVTRGGRSLGDQLVDEGLARNWTGRREPWCA